jgi:hypothetical protein
MTLSSLLTTTAFPPIAPRSFAPVSSAQYESRTIFTVGGRPFKGSSGETGGFGSGTGHSTLPDAVLSVDTLELVDGLPRCNFRVRWEWLRPLQIMAAPKFNDLTL